MPISDYVLRGSDILIKLIWLRDVYRITLLSMFERIIEWSNYIKNSTKRIDEVN